jgi:hypothetical protein
MVNKHMNTKSIFPVRSMVPAKFVMVSNLLLIVAALLATPSLVVLVAVGFFGASPANAACCRNYEEFAAHCRGQGGVPSANPLRCNAPSGGGNSTPTPRYDDGAARRSQEAAAAAERQRQAEAERIERERLAEEKRKKDAEFIRDRDAAATTLKGSSGAAMSQLKGLSDSDNSGLKGSGFDTSSQLKSAPVGGSNLKGAVATSPSGDPNVVDARNVPSGLPKALDNAIATAYSSAPPGVSDRVRKGFQAVMGRDWKVAKAWFQDALNRDPNNAGLKRLVALADSPQQPNKQQPATVDARNEPPGLVGRSDLKGAGAPPSKTKPAPASTTQTRIPLQLPDPNDIYLLFPGLKAIEDKKALDILFGLDAQPPSSKSGKTK